MQLPRTFSQLCFQFRDHAPIALDPSPPPLAIVRRAASIWRPPCAVPARRHTRTRTAPRSRAARRLRSQPSPGMPAMRLRPSPLRRRSAAHRAAWPVIENPRQMHEWGTDAPVDVHGVKTDTRVFHQPGVDGAQSEIGGIAPSKPSAPGRCRPTSASVDARTALRRRCRGVGSCVVRRIVVMLDMAARAPGRRTHLGAVPSPRKSNAPTGGGGSKRSCRLGTSSCAGPP